MQIVDGVRTPTGADPALEANKEVVRRICGEVWTEGKLDLIEELVAADAIDHRAEEEAQGIEGARQHIAELRAAIDDLRLDIVEIVAEGDLVSCELQWSGYHVGNLFGIPPTYRWARAPQAITYRIENGKIAEIWQVIDMLTLLEALGVAPPQGKGPFGILAFVIGNIFRMGIRQARKAPPKPPPPAGWPFGPAPGR